MKASLPATGSIASAGHARRAGSSTAMTLATLAFESRRNFFSNLGEACRANLAGDPLPRLGDPPGGAPVAGERRAVAVGWSGVRGVVGLGQCSRRTGHQAAVRRGEQQIECDPVDLLRCWPFAWRRRGVRMLRRRGAGDRGTGTMGPPQRRPRPAVPAAVARHLTELGIPAKPAEVINSAQTAAHYLADRLAPGQQCCTSRSESAEILCRVHLRLLKVGRGLCCRGIAAG